MLRSSMSNLGQSVITVDDALAKKRKLELEICDLLNLYQVSTGLTPSAIVVRTMPRLVVGEPDSIHIARVLVTVELP